MKNIVYVIKDTRYERQEGEPSYVSGGSATTHNRVMASFFPTKKAANAALKAWAKVMDYESPDTWLSVVPVFGCERFLDPRVAQRKGVKQ